MKRGMVAVVVTAAALLVSALPAAGKTTVKVKDKVVTIKVPIDCVGCKGKKAPDGSDVAKYWKKTAEDAWNAAFAKHPYCSKYKFKLDIKIKARGDDFQFTEGRHRILAGLPGSGLAQTGWDGVFESTPGGDPGQRTPDGTRYFENDGDGSMGADATPTVIIHEFGHVIGLGDDRDDNGDVVTGRDRTVMAGGSTNSDGTRNTQNSRLKFDQQLIDRIGNQLAKLGKIKCGEVWEGTFTGTEMGGECTLEVEGTLSLVVAKDGTVTGEGERTDTEVGCPTTGPVITTVSISGRATDRAFEIFGFTAVDGGPFRIPKSGTRARRDSFVTVQSDPDIYSVQLHCVSC
ncbi:MAG: hypothetical protein WD598_09170 [Acidimicrobiia bacterium]